MGGGWHLGTWAHGLVDFGDSPESLARHVDRLANVGFELIIPCVKNPPGYADFITDVGDTNPDYPDWDPLKVLAETADQRGVKVHAWFCVFAEGEHSALLKRKPHAAAVHREQISSVAWACACRPEVQEYELALYRSVADGYPVHGLHLDYIRTGGVCRCDYCKAQMAGRGIDVTSIEPRDPKYAEWTEWRCSRVTSFVREMRELTRSKDIELSAAVLADVPACRNSNGQDWVGWAEASLVDLLIPMNYDSSTRNVALRTRAHVAQVSGRCPVWEGLGKRSTLSELTTAVLGEQIQAAKDEGAQGIVTFNYPALSDEDLAVVKASK